MSNLRTPVPHDAPHSEKDYHAGLVTSGLPNLLPPPSSSISAFSLNGGGEGWASTVRVRLLHGVVRRRIRNKHADQLRQEALDEGLGEEMVVPLNMEEMAATLASFSVAPLWCMERMGLLSYGGSEPVREDYLAVWRWVLSCKFIGLTIGRILTQPEPESDIPINVIAACFFVL